MSKIQKWCQKAEAFFTPLSHLDVIGQLLVLKDNNPYVILKALKKQHFTNEALREMVTNKPSFMPDELYYTAAGEYRERFGFPNEIYLFILNNANRIDFRMLWLAQMDFYPVLLLPSEEMTPLLLKLFNGEQEVIDAFLSLSEALEIKKKTEEAIAENRRNLENFAMETDFLRQAAIDEVDLQHQLRLLLFPSKEVRIKIYDGDARLNKVYFDCADKIENWWKETFKRPLF